jgi:hypothetical protein
MELQEIVQEIQLIVAPAVMISSAALLLLGFQTKFSNLSSRYRSLNQELRELKKLGRKEPWQIERFESLRQQVGHLLDRATHVKNAILLTYGGILGFLMTSALIFLSARGWGLSAIWIQASFILGMILEFAAAFTMMIEVALAFKVIRIESQS